MKTIFIFLILLTATLRSQWIKQITPADVYGLTCIDFYDQNTGVAGGWKFSTDFIGRAIYTTNSGVNWIISVMPDSARFVYKIQLLNQSTGFIAGVFKTNLNSYRGMFLKTTNGGQIWFNYGTLPSNIFYLVGMKFINASTGFLNALLAPPLLDTYEILKSTNGGLSWENQLTIDSVNLININNSDINNIYACGTYYHIGSPNGIILMSTNGGINWTRQNFSNVMQFKDINFATFNTGFAVGGPASNGMIYRTTDSGFNWAISIILPLNTSLNGIEFVNGTGKGIAVGNEGNAFVTPLIYRTTNYGANWTSYLIPDTAMTLLSQSLVNLNTWFVCGGASTAIIYKSTNGGEIGIPKISNDVPEKFSLLQNYPNPFNPISKIKFQISKLTDAKIIIFDALGREIQILVNEKLSPGTYETEFDGTNCPSGVYYYRLAAGNYSETKKMILIK